jgi:hypothetical protein
LADELPEGETEPQDTSGKAADGKDPLSKLGLRAAPAVNTHGGVRVYGQIVRRTQINLVRLRALAVTKEGQIDEAETLKLRRYLLGLALVAARVQTVYTHRDDKAFNLSLRDAFDYAQQSAATFGVGANKEVGFDAKATVEAVKKAKADKKKK